MAFGFTPNDYLKMVQEQYSDFKDDAHSRVREINDGRVRDTR